MHRRRQGFADGKGSLTMEFAVEDVRELAREGIPGPSSIPQF
jgi:hypothetical protein